MNIPVALLLCSLLFLRIGTSLKSIPEKSQVQVKGSITSEPVVGISGTSFSVSGYFVKVPQRLENLHAGDIVALEGEMNGSIIQKAEIEFVDSRSLGQIDVFKNINDFITSSLHEPYSSLTLGVTFGIKNTLPPEFKKKLIKSGVFHMVVASGANISTLTSICLFILLLVLPRPLALLLLFPLIWGYALLTGFASPIIRAAFMATIVFSAQVVGLYFFPLVVLVITIFIMLMINPLWIFDLGFYLSVATTGSIILIEPVLYRKIEPWFKRYKPVVKLFTVSLAAQIGALPLVYLFFRQVSLVAPLTNVLVSWVTTPILVLGIISSVLSLISPFLGRVILLCIYPFAYWFVFIVNLLGS